MDKQIREILGPEADDLLSHQCATISRDMLHLPGPAFVDEVVTLTDRSPRVLRSLQAVFDHGRLAGTGYLSILPVDQGVEHSAGASFATNPICSAIPIPTTSGSSGSWTRLLIWAPWRSGRPSTTARRSHDGRLRRSPPPSRRRMNWACSRDARPFKDP